MGPAIEIPIQYVEQHDSVQFNTQMFEDDYTYIAQIELVLDNERVAHCFAKFNEDEDNVLTRLQVNQFIFNQMSISSTIQLQCSINTGALGISLDQPNLSLGIPLHSFVQ